MQEALRKAGLATESETKHAESWNRRMKQAVSEGERVAAALKRGEFVEPEMIKRARDQLDALEKEKLVRGR